MRKWVLAIVLAVVLLLGGVRNALADSYCPCRVCSTETRSGWYYISDDSWLGGYWAWGNHEVIVCTVQ